MPNSFTLTKNEYFGKGDKCVIGYHDPRKATLFATEEEAREFASTFNMETRIGEAETHFKLFEKVDYVYRRLTVIDPVLNRKYNNEDANEVIKWWIEYSNSPEGSVSTEIYLTWPNLYSMCKHLWSSYTITELEEKCNSFQIYTSTDGKFEEFKTELMKVMDHVTFTEDGYKKFAIFDHELSEYETRYFLYKNDNDCKIRSRYSDRCQGTMEKCFDLMKREYFYNRH
jgi:hypothetical protein